MMQGIGRGGRLLEVVMDIIFQIIFTVIGAFLSVVLTQLLRQNGRVLEEIRDVGRRMDEGFRRMDARTAKIAELIVLEAQKTRRAIKRRKR